MGHVSTRSKPSNTDRNTDYEPVHQECTVPSSRRALAREITSYYRWLFQPKQIASHAANKLYEQLRKRTLSQASVDLCDTGTFCIRSCIACIAVRNSCEREMKVLNPYSSSILGVS